jgi:hypothetical protein
VRRFRRSLPPDLQAAWTAFEDVLAVLEPAKARLTQVVPTTRVPGRPLGEAASEFGGALAEAASRMPAWRRPEVERWWDACDAGVREARRRVEGLAVEPDGFESLIWSVEQLLDPLEPFTEAARRFSDLRVRGR